MPQTAKLFDSGDGQTIQLPDEYRFEGKQVYVKRVGEMVVLIPYERPWASFFESLDMFSDDFMDSRDQPAELDIRETLFE